MQSQINNLNRRAGRLVQVCANIVKIDDPIFVTMSNYYENLKKVLFKLDPEVAHNLVVSTMKSAASLPGVLDKISARLTCTDSALSTQIFGKVISSPVGLAAGFDKNCELVDIAEKLGFGFVECGTVTRFAQPGNAKPRIFRFPESEALINSLGFNNRGADAASETLNSRRGTGLVGVNIGKSKVTNLEDASGDYVYSFEKLYKFADYFAINVSSPNTANLRELQRDLTPLLSALQTKNSELSNAIKCAPKPILVKIAPDLDLNALDTIVETCLTLRVTGLIATNTTISRSGITLDAPLSGGLSGRPLFEKSLEILKQVRKASGGQMTLIGVGGIFSAEDAYAKIKAGASLVQVYTGWIYKGPEFLPELNRGLGELLRRDGFNSINEAIGTAVNP